eukprot:Sdes_comp22060_c0_seq1m20590
MTTATALASQKAAEPSLKDIKLVVSDLDGTLLNGNHAVSATTQETILKLHQARVPFVIATGKTRRAALDLIETLSLTSYGIFCNGGLVTDGAGNVVFEEYLSGHLVAHLLKFAQIQNVSFVCYCGETIVSSRLDNWTDCLLKYHEPPCQKVSNLAELVSRDQLRVHKLIYLHDPALMPLLRTNLEKYAQEHHLSDFLHITQAVPECLEASPHGINKAVAVSFVADRLGISMSQIAAFGDGQNDQEMLMEVGAGVAMGNASSEVKTCAKYSTLSNDEDGVSHFLCKYFLSCV